MTDTSVASKRPSYIHPLMDQQIALEEQMLVTGRDEFFADIEKAKSRGEESGTSYGARLVKLLVEPMTNAIEEFLEQATSGRAGRRHSAVKYLEAVDPRVVSYLTLKTILDSITKRETLQRAAIRTASAIEDECHFIAFREQHPEKFKVTQKKIADSTTRRRAKTIMHLMANRAGTEFARWPETEKLHLGQKLIELLRESTGLVDIVRQTDGTHDTSYYVVATPATLEWIEQSNERMAILSPAYWPTIVPPKRWTNPWNGGYWSEFIRRHPIVKTRNRNYLEELAEMDLSQVYGAVNSMQETPWRINVKVREVLREAWERGLEIAKLPARDPVPLPSKPAALVRDGELLTAWRKEKNTVELDAWMAKHGEEFKDWKKQASLIHGINQKLKSKRLQVRKILQIADQFGDYERIYFPVQLDFRGRAYYLPMFLNPQGPDVAKALLTFADGKPIGLTEECNGIFWLAVHGANVFGYDKTSLEDREQWVLDNSDRIRSVARDPWGPELEFWSKADKPWQFLAFCFEWDAAMEHGPGFVSTLPIALDGSCNGLQHYSAALRDPVGGAAVNLLPSELPNDIYAEVAEVATAQLRLIGCTSGTNAEMAQKWLAFGVDRKITKRAVMTLPYGSTLFSCREFIEEAIREKLAEGKPNVFSSGDRDGIFAASLFLQPIVWESIGKVVKAARVGMDWLKECARIAASEGLPVNWKTPDGFLVQQAYHDTSARRIKTVLDGQTVFLSLREEKPTIDKRLQAQGIAPNWVHSMDATALRMYVNLARENGIRHFALVHDSYGTVAADVEMMGACLREAFVQLYTEHDPLAEFRVDVWMMLSEENQKKLPEIPEKGDLDVTLVRESDFFFA